MHFALRAHGGGEMLTPAHVGGLQSCGRHSDCLWQPHAARGDSLVQGEYLHNNMWHADSWAIAGVTSALLSALFAVLQLAGKADLSRMEKLEQQVELVLDEMAVLRSRQVAKKRNTSW